MFRRRLPAPPPPPPAAAAGSADSDDDGIAVPPPPPPPPPPARPVLDAASRASTRSLLSAPAVEEGAGPEPVTAEVSPSPSTPLESAPLVRTTSAQRASLARVPSGGGGSIVPGTISFTSRRSVPAPPVAAGSPGSPGAVTPPPLPRVSSSSSLGLRRPSGNALAATPRDREGGGDVLSGTPSPASAAMAAGMPAAASPSPRISLGKLATLPSGRNLPPLSAVPEGDGEAAAGAGAAAALSSPRSDTPIALAPVGSTAVAAAGPAGDGGRGTRATSSASSGSNAASRTSGSGSGPVPSPAVEPGALTTVGTPGAGGGTPPNRSSSDAASSLARGMAAGGAMAASSRLHASPADTDIAVAASGGARASLVDAGADSRARDGGDGVNGHASGTSTGSREWRTDAGAGPIGSPNAAVHVTAPQPPPPLAEAMALVADVRTAQRELAEKAAAVLSDHGLTPGAAAAVDVARADLAAAATALEQRKVELEELEAKLEAAHVRQMAELAAERHRLLEATAAAAAVPPAPAPAPPPAPSLTRAQQRQLRQWQSMAALVHLQWGRQQPAPLRLATAASNGRTAAAGAAEVRLGAVLADGGDDGGDASDASGSESDDESGGGDGGGGGRSGGDVLVTLRVPRRLARQVDRLYRAKVGAAAVVADVPQLVAPVSEAADSASVGDSVVAEPVEAAAPAPAASAAAAAAPSEPSAVAVTALASAVAALLHAVSPRGATSRSPLPTGSATSRSPERSSEGKRSPHDGGGGARMRAGSGRGGGALPARRPLRLGGGGGGGGASSASPSSTSMRSPAALASGDRGRGGGAASPATRRGGGGALRVIDSGGKTGIAAVLSPVTRWQREVDEAAKALCDPALSDPDVMEQLLKARAEAPAFQPSLRAEKWLRRG